MNDIWKPLAIPFVCLTIATVAIWASVGWVLQKINNEFFTIMTIFFLAIITVILWVNTLAGFEIEVKR